MDNKDLVWDLDRFQKRNLAQHFVMSFENKLCVFSAAVGQLYSNYSIFFPKEEDRKLVILPDPYSHHDSFYNIPEAACKPTGLLLVPADAADPKGRLNLIIPIKRAEEKVRKVPLDVGLQLIKSKRPPGRPFLPVLVKGDLRELDTDTPCLHLHSLSVAHMGDLSELTIKGINAVIEQGLVQLANRVANK